MTTPEQDLTGCAVEPKEKAFARLEAHLSRGDCVRVFCDRPNALGSFDKSVFGTDFTAWLIAAARKGIEAEAGIAKQTTCYACDEPLIIVCPSCNPYRPDATPQKPEPSGEREDEAGTIEKCGYKTGAPNRCCVHDAVWPPGAKGCLGSTPSPTVEPWWDDDTKPYTKEFSQPDKPYTGQFSQQPRAKPSPTPGDKDVEREAPIKDGLGWLQELLNIADEIGGGNGEFIRKAVAALQPAVVPGHTDLMVPPETIAAFLEANPLPSPSGSVEGLVERAKREAHFHRRHPFEVLNHDLAADLLEGLAEALRRLSKGQA